MFDGADSVFDGFFPQPDQYLARIPQSPSSCSLGAISPNGMDAVRNVDRRYGASINDIHRMFSFFDPLTYRKSYTELV